MTALVDGTHTLKLVRDHGQQGHLRKRFEMLVVSYVVNNKAGEDLILPEIRRYKNVQLGPATFALVAQDDVRRLERDLACKVLPGDLVWILTASGPCSELGPELPPKRSLH